MTRRIAVPAIGALILSALAAGVLFPPATDAQIGGRACGDLLNYYHRAALDRDYYFGAVNESLTDDELDGENFIEAAGSDDSFEFVEEESAQAAPPSPEAAPEPAESADGSASATAPADLGARSETGTNVQVAGVDESDIVKTNGKQIFILREHDLIIAAVDGESPLVVGSHHFSDRGLLSSGGPLEMLLAGDRLYVFRPVYYRSAAASESERGLQVVEFNISDPREPRVLRTLDTYGSFAAARLVGSSLRLLLNHEGGAGLWRWDNNDWQRTVEQTQLPSWLPLFSLIDYVRGGWSWGYTVPCEQVQAPPEPRSVQTTVLMSFDTERGLADWAATGIIGRTSAVYASSAALYAAIPDQFGNTTQIHRADLSDPQQPVWSGSGEVPGQLINQFALSEYQGRLRAASTYWSGRRLESRLTIFEIETDGLSELSHLDGLGPSERIFAVRFLGPQAYVVTFRQIDPLYVLDLTDPAEPKVAGELKIPGFSSYLHPLGDGLLLGVGQEADERTGRPLGLQVSLFDVSDPTKPTRIDQLALSPETRSTTFDHRAFTYWLGYAFVPAAAPWLGGGQLFAICVEDRRLSLHSTIESPNQVLRTLIVSDDLWVVESAALRGFTLPEFDTLGRAPY